MESCKHLFLAVLIIATYTVGFCRAGELNGSADAGILSTQKVATQDDQLTIRQPKQTFTVSAAEDMFPNDPSVHTTIHPGTKTNLTSGVQSKSNDLRSTPVKKSDKRQGKSPVHTFREAIGVTVGLLTMPLWLPPALYIYLQIRSDYELEHAEDKMAVRAHAKKRDCTFNVDGR